MAHRPGGLEHSEVDHALSVLRQVDSHEALERAVDSVPVLHAPVVHAILRQQYLQLKNAKSPSLANFEALYHDLFSLLHTRCHERLVRDAKAAYAGATNLEGSHDDVESFAPPFFAAIVRALGDTLPARRGPHHDPAVDRSELHAELESLLGREVLLPPYEPTQGSRWCALTVGCGSCGRSRLEVRSYIADVVVAPELSGPLRAGLLNRSRCTSCGDVLAYPQRVWIVESPGPSDPLAALSCVWRLAPDVYCYQAPPGTRRDEQNDRILEVRFDQLWNSVSWPPQSSSLPASGATATTISVAYSVDELVHALDRAVPSADRMPLAMETIIRDLLRKVESGVLPLSEAIDAALMQSELLGKDWPIAHPGVPRQWKGAPLAHLFQSLVGEGVLRARGEGLDARAVFASTTASSLLSIGEVGLAEAALARADDCIVRAAPGRARDLAAAMVKDIRADHLEALGRFDESAVLRSELGRTGAVQGDGLPARFARQALASSEALGLFKRDEFAHALAAFQRCIPGWSELLEAAKAANGVADQSTFAKSAMHGLSGDLANLAAVFTAIAEDLVVAEIAKMPDLSDAERVARLTAAHADPMRALARLGETLPALEPFLPDGVSRDRLLHAADDLLRRALDLSEQVEGWEFAGVQAHRLAALYAHVGEFQLAEEYANRAIRHAARAGDHERVWTAAAFLASRALDRGDGTAALESLEVSAREHIRHEVGLGQHAGLTRAALSLSEAAFRSVAVGGDPMRAIMIAESLRAAVTAASIVTGTPAQPTNGATSESIAALRAERERIELQLIWSPDDVDARTELARVESALAAERDRIALRDPRYGRWVDASDIDIASAEGLRRALSPLGPTCVWLGALETSDRWWSWTTGVEGAAVQSVGRPLAMAALTAADDGNRWTDAVLAELAGALLAPHAQRIDALKPDDTLVISVAGAFQGVPFAALPWRGQRLCERATLVVVHGFGMFEAAMQRPRLPLRSCALVGGPKRADLPALPGATAEIKSIAQLLQGAGRTVALASGAQATVQAFAKAASSNDAIHVACHAVVDDPPASTARLMLSPDLVRGESGDLSEGGIVSEVELKPGLFVNLAGCATGRTRDHGGSALGGLVPAFLVAGARSVIASLWPIDDVPAAIFQESIYRHIVGGAAPAAALAAAQRQALKGELGAAARSTSVWAAYALYGAG